MSKKKVVSKNVQGSQLCTVQHPSGHIYVNQRIEDIEIAYGLSKSELEEKGFTFNVNKF